MPGAASASGRAAMTGRRMQLRPSRSSPWENAAQRAGTGTQSAGGTSTIQLQGRARRRASSRRVRGRVPAPAGPRGAPAARLLPTVELLGGLAHGGR